MADPAANRADKVARTNPISERMEEKVALCLPTAARAQPQIKAAGTQI
jgi:hypothetical protein